MCLNLSAYFSLFIHFYALQALHHASTIERFGITCTVHAPNTHTHITFDCYVMFQFQKLQFQNARFLLIRLGLFYIFSCCVLFLKPVHNVIVEFIFCLFLYSVTLIIMCFSSHAIGKQFHDSRYDVSAEQRGILC